MTSNSPWSDLAANGAGRGRLLRHSWTGQSRSTLCRLTNNKIGLRPVQFLAFGPAAEMLQKKLDRRRRHGFQMKVQRHQRRTAVAGPQTVVAGCDHHVLLYPESEVPQGPCGTDGERIDRGADLEALDLLPHLSFRRWMKNRLWLPSGKVLGRKKHVTLPPTLASVKNPSDTGTEKNHL